MATDPQHHWVSIDEYLHLDQTSNTRYEYWDGQLVAMSGGSRDHSLIASNIEHWLFDKLPPECIVYRSDVKLKLNASKYVLPDVQVTCDPGELAGQDQFICALGVIFEVLSPSTETIDRDEKLQWYQAIPSLQAYVLVNYKRQEVEMYRRENQQWTYERYQSGQDVLLAGLQVRLPVAIVYARTQVPKEQKNYKIVRDGTSLSLQRGVPEERETTPDWGS
jgi:Uma2 family endonuclease